ncbi:MAG TPA: hypothetical protein VK525_03250 [Candidatus Saccharimonadales bacterium]|nr:hypothetical protein [Candidatus Saccharimonadales bacterium]
MKGTTVQKRRLCWLVLTGLTVIGTSETRTVAQTKSEPCQPQPVKVKEAVASVGTGEAVQVRVTLLDKSFRSGYVSDVGDHSFIVTNPVTETQVEVGYNEVARLSADNTVTGVKVSFPRERPKVLRAAMRVATLAIPGHRRTETTSNNFLSRPAIIVLVVLGVGLILIGVELGKS